jgi:hypothetical protein
MIVMQLQFAINKTPTAKKKTQPKSKRMKSGRQSCSPLRQNPAIVFSFRLRKAWRAHADSVSIQFLHCLSESWGRIAGEFSAESDDYASEMTILAEIVDFQPN